MNGTPLRAGLRRRVVRRPHDLVDIRGPDERHAIPVITCKAESFDLCAWCAEFRPELDALRERHGAVLLRGFQVGGAQGLRDILSSLGEESMPYVERSSPRTRVGTDVYTSTEYPASQTIPPHNENSYANQFPLHIAFYCRMPASQGGETPLVDCRRVLGGLSEATVAHFRERQLLYVRNYHPGLGLAWSEVFGVQTRAEVEECCHRSGYRFEWSGEGVLRTWRGAPAIVLHPSTREPVWFNHAAFFHVTSLPDEVSFGLLQRFAPQELPNHVFYGDGEPISAETMAEVRAAYRSAMQVVAWQAEDLLLLDNILTAHARMPYREPRSVLVSMGGKLDAASLQRW